MTEDEPVQLQIDGMLDLHTFRPQEVKDLVPEYLGECQKRGILHIRIIHGKGSGILRSIVHSLLKKDARVLSFQNADPGGGGWGATEIELRPGS